MKNSVTVHCRQDPCTRPQFRDTVKGQKLTPNQPMGIGNWYRSLRPKSCHQQSQIVFPIRYNFNLPRSNAPWKGPVLVAALQWHHNERNGVSNHQPHDCLLNRLLSRGSKKTPKFCDIGLCAENSSVTGEFPSQMASNAENVSIWWRHQWLLSIRYTFNKIGCVLQNLVKNTNPAKVKEWNLFIWLLAIAD